MASRDDKPLMASVTIDVDFSRLPHLVRALMVEEGHKLDELASRFKSDVVESLALNNGDSIKLNTPLAMRRIY